MKSVNFVTPSTLEEALDELEKHESCKLLAGGTDLVAAANIKVMEYPDYLISLAKIPGLKGISWDSGKVSIGSLTTYTEIVNSKVIKEKLPNLWQACYEMGTPAIRNMGTLGGNIANASPAGDALVALLGSDAWIKVVSKNNIREIKLRDFFLGPGKTVLEKGEVITEIIVPLDETVNFHVFRRVRPSKGSSTVLVNMAVEAKLDNGIFRKIRIVLGSVAPTPVRLYHMEKALEGKQVNEEVVNAALEHIEKDINPIDDGRASAWYRRKVSENILKHALLNQ